MSDLFWLADAQMARLEPFFPKSHGKPRVDDRRVLGGIIFINRNGLRWRDAPAALVIYWLWNSMSPDPKQDVRFLYYNWYMLLAMNRATRVNILVPNDIVLTKVTASLYFNECEG